MSEPCKFGCTLLNEHATGCTCTAECAEHEGHCTGCLPRSADVGAWCRRHYDRTREQLERLPELVLDLETLPDGRIATRSRDGSDVSRRPTKVDQNSPSPAHDLLDDAVTWAHNWAEGIADRLGHVGPFTYTPAGVPRTDLTTLTGYLTAHLPHIAEAHFAMDFATELRQLVRTVELAAGQDRLTHRMKGDRCLSCGRKSLTREDGSDRVECRNPDCRRVWREEEYLTMVRWTTQSQAAS